MTKWEAIMSYIHTESRGGPVLGPHLEGIAVSRFESTPSTVTARLRELRDVGFLTQDTGRIGAKKKRYVAYRCSLEQWRQWKLGGPELLKAHLREKKHKRLSSAGVAPAAPAGEATGVEVGTGSPLPPTRAPVAQLTLGNAAEPKRSWER